MEQWLLFCVLLGQILLAPSNSLLTCAKTNSSTLQLPPGLRLNFLSSYNLTTGDPLLPLGSMFTIATPTLDEGGLFLPILSSPFFINNQPLNSGSPGSLSTSIRGYSLGFYMSSSFYLYLAVCAGFLGSVNSSANLIGTDLDGFGVISINTASGIVLYQTVDGFAVPVWIANLDSPIHYIDKISLVVQRVADLAGSSTDHDHGQDIFELQLRDGEDVVWRVRCNANLMEMQDNGHLNLLHNSTNGSQLVWQTPMITDTLVQQGKSLEVGKELLSNDSSYVARMEKGGLVFYKNNMQFNRERQRPPYWVFPVANFSMQYPANTSLNQVISSAPCSNSSAHLDPPNDGITYLLIDPGMCTTDLSTLGSDVFESSVAHFMFWKLEGDGMLYSYSVSTSGTGSAASVTKSPQNYYGITSRGEAGWMAFFQPLVLSWQQCNLPMACGPLGLCTPGAPSCSCSPSSDFEPVNSTDLLQGCRRRIDLPNCTSNGTGHTSLTDFVELNSTASIFLFNEWNFNSTPGMQVNACKQSCSLECACNGFFYQVHTSSCFFMADEISLITVHDTNYTPILQLYNSTAPSKSYTIFAKDYITFLKVASAADQPSANRRAALIAESTIIPSLVVGLLVGMVAYLLIRERLRKTHEQNTSPMLSTEESKELQDILPLLPNRFSYRELCEATESFKRLLGSGGCGSVYAGILADGRKVAVKVLQVARLQGIHHSKQFLAEIATIGRTNHHNIVRLIGFCWEVSQRLLVYEYVERGSLDRWIFSRESQVALVNDTFAEDVATPTSAPLLLDWKTRYNVALGIARGLNYLHEDCEQPIFHFDIKPQNILLDTEFVAKLADFGMSKLMERDMSTVVTGMRGTPGYIAPEWCTQGTVSKKSDIYSMGMVFLEIVGGRKNLDVSLLSSSLEPEEQEAWHFPSWAARKCEQGQAMELVDVRLLQEGGGFDAEQALRLIHISFWCIQENPAMRPYAPTVVQWLESSSSSYDVEQPPFSKAMSMGSGPNKHEQLQRKHITFSSSLHEY